MKTKKALLCLGAAATLFFYGCESKDNNGISSADSSGSVITTAVQNIAGLFRIFLYKTFLW